MGAAPWEWFLLGAVAALAGVALVFGLARRTAGQRPEDPDQPPGPRSRPFAARVRAAVRRSLGWLFGTRGRAVYRARYPAAAGPELGVQVEAAVRAACPDFEVRADGSPGRIIRAHRGRTAGFVIQFIHSPGRAGAATGLVLVARWSRWHSAAVWVATAGFFATLLGGIGVAAGAGWPLPGVGYLILIAAFAVAFAVARLSQPVLARVESAADERFPDHELAAAVELVREAVDRARAEDLAVVNAAEENPPDRR